ncbi:MAG: EAL domain-containing protein, partial [Betaproteobacteria bacterium]|nr:EAL domain-containing protein [Betaproteobacteria bacterium]
MQEVFIGRQPILDRKHDLVAYELSFRSAQTAGANAADDVSATANVIV